MWLAYRRCSEDPRGTLFRRPAGIFQQANTFNKEKRDIVRGKKRKRVETRGGGKGRKSKKRERGERKERGGRKEGRRKARRWSARPIL